MVNISKFKGDIVVEVSLIDRLSDDKYFKGKADANNVKQMKLLKEGLKENGVVFPD